MQAIDPSEIILALFDVDLAAVRDGRGQNLPRVKDHTER
jgi:hypothetical protein